MPGIAAVILAAGGSTRMGVAKQLLKFEGRTLLRRAVDAAFGAGLRPIVAALGCQADAMRRELDGLGVVAAENTQWRRGMGSSIRRGVQAVIESAPDAEAIAILLADQPMVTAATIRGLIDRLEESGKESAAAAYAGAIGPPAVVRRGLFPELLALPDDRGAKAIFARDLDAVALFACEEGGFDVDTPDDFQRLRDR